MSYFLLSIIPWALVTMVVGALQITAAVILLKERHLGTWLMLAGCGIMLLGQLGRFAIEIAVEIGKAGINSISYTVASSAVAMLGALLFAIGLLLHALRQRAKASRVVELESIIASMRGR